MHFSDYIKKCDQEFSNKENFEGDFFITCVQYWIWTDDLNGHNIAVFCSVFNPVLRSLQP